MFKARFFEYQYNQKLKKVKVALDSHGCVMFAIRDLSHIMLKDDLYGVCASLGMRVESLINEPHYAYPRRTTMGFVTAAQAHLLASAAMGDEPDYIRSFICKVEKDMLHREDAVRAERVASMREIPASLKQRAVGQAPKIEPKQEPEPVQEHPELRALPSAASNATESQPAAQVFESEEFGRLDIIMIDDKPYFPAVECAKILGYSNPYKAVGDHCDHLTKREGVSKTTNQYGVTTEQVVQKSYIPEGDLYRLIIRSKLPSAEKFERWVFDEVLPTLRRTGSYSVKPTTLFTPENMAMLSQGFLDEYHRRLELEEELAEIQPKIEQHDALMASDDVISFRTMANFIQQNGVAMGQNRLFELMRNVGMLCKSGESRNLPTQRAMNLGIFRVIEVPVFMNGATQIKKTTRITTKGQQYLFDRIVRSGEWLMFVDLDDDPVDGEETGA